MSSSLRQQQLENQPLLNDDDSPNDPEEEENFIGSPSINKKNNPNSSKRPERSLRTREAPRDHANFFPLRHGKFSTLEITLAFICVLLLILMSVFAGLYTRGRSNKHTHPPPHQTPVPPPGPIPTVIPPPNDTEKDLCLTPDCVIIAAQILSDIDPEADPCDDFFKFTCGGWLKKNTIPDDKGGYGYFNSLYEDNQKVLKEILEDDFPTFPNHPNDTIPSPDETIDKQNFYKLQSMYQSCMNETQIGLLRAEPLLPIIKKILSYFPNDEISPFMNFIHKSYLSSLSSDPLNATATLSYLSSIGVNPLFAFGVEADAKDPEYNGLYLDQSGLGLPSKEYYKEESILKVYKSVIAELLEKALKKNKKSDDFNNFDGSCNDNDDNNIFDQKTDISEGNEHESLIWNDYAESIVEFERDLANISLSAEDYKDPEAIYNNHTLGSLSALSPSILWTEYLIKLIPKDQAVPSKIIISSNKYFSDLSKLLEKTSSSKLSLYFIWQSVFKFADSLDESFRQPIRKLNSVLRGIDENIKPKRWEVCLKVIDETIGKSREMADDTITAIKNTFINRLPELEWLDEETRNKAIYKVKKIIQKVGYPITSPNIESPKSLAVYYDKLVIKENQFFENKLSYETWASNEQWKMVNKKVDRGVWYMTPQTVNAYYNPTANEIVFPAGILQPPFFSAKAPEYINYGSVGMVVGHELTHAFDDSGRQYDASGRLTQWWSNDTIKEFKKKTICFIDQYSNFTINDPYGKPVHLNESFNAWLTRFESDPKEEIYNNELLPGLSKWSREQLFFISYGRSWCSKVRPERAVELVRVDPHSPAKWRVNGVVKNSKEFADAFKCKIGREMNPSEKCILW
ncbi:21458_t:CDS:10 [Entrophospora sp. SA101]|nr:21458_t:CDS:10 [Entrophospora sp. SA101]